MEQRKKSDLNQRSVKSLLKHHANDILNSQHFVNSKNHIQHGTMSVHDHSLNVAKMSLKISRKLPFSVRERELVRGALLHDYFQYDWHGKKISLQTILKFYKMHGFTHAKSALSNAEKEYPLTRRERDIIEKHMFPLNIHPPRCKEAWIVTIADKYCSILETIHIHKGEHYGKHHGKPSR